MRGRLGALVASSRDNVAYLTGFSGFSEGLHDARTLAVFTPTATALVVPAIDVPAVVAEAVDVDHVVCHGELAAAFPERQSAEVRRIQEIVSATASSPADALVAALALTGIRGESVGLDESRLGPAAWQDLVGHLSGLEAVPAAGHLAEARRVKSPYEIECLDRRPSHRRGGAGCGHPGARAGHDRARCGRALCGRGRQARGFANARRRRHGRPDVDPSATADGSRAAVGRPRALRRGLDAQGLLRKRGADGGVRRADATGGAGLSRPPGGPRGGQ